jgi:hypothetical protein
MHSHFVSSSIFTLSDFLPENCEYYGIFSYPDACWPGDRGNDELQIHNTDIPQNAKS